MVISTVGQFCCIRTLARLSVSPSPGFSASMTADGFTKFASTARMASSKISSSATDRSCSGPADMMARQFNRVASSSSNAAVDSRPIRRRNSTKTGITQRKRSASEAGSPARILSAGSMSSTGTNNAPNGRMRAKAPSVSPTLGCLNTPSQATSSVTSSKARSHRRKSVATRDDNKLLSPTTCV